MKRIIAISKSSVVASIFALVFGMGVSAQAVELGNGFGLELTLTAASDYRDTGISQTQRKPTIQAEAILQHESGLYAGVFSSNIDFDTKARREDMYFAGINIPFTEDVYLDTYLGRYEYEKEAHDDLNEFFAELGAYGFQPDFTYDFDFRGHVPNNTNWSLGYNFQLPYETNLLVRYGYTDLKFDAFTSGDGDTRRTFNDREVKVSKDVVGVNVFASYVDTNLSKSECYSAVGFDDVCSATVVFGVSKTF